MLYIPICQDTEYIYTGDSLTYSIELSGETVFTGRAYAAPGQNTISINVNRICENYLSNNSVESILNGTVNNQVAYDAIATFYLRDESGSTLAVYDFFYNYNYNPADQFSTTGFTYIDFSEPISDGYAYPMKALYTYFLGASIANSNSSEYYSRPVCDAEYALYYLNAKGGWDAFVIEGSSQRTDKISRHQYNKSYNNQTIQYERNTYTSEIETSWKLNTGILDDEQARRLCWHLLASNRVYLHDLKADKIVPVVITNTQNVYNTYKNNDHQPIQYEIDLIESQTKLRQ